MRKLLMLIFTLILIFSMAACAYIKDDKKSSASFNAVITEITDTAIIISPEKDSTEAVSSDLISLNGGTDIKLYDAEGKEADRSIFTVGSAVKVVYDSDKGIAESYPAQLWAKELHFVSSGPVIDSDNCTALIDSPYESVNDFDYIAIKFIESTITADGLTLEFISEADRELIYGSFYALEIKLDGKWYQLPYIYEGEGDIGWDDIAYIVPAKGSSQWSTDWKWLYGSLSDGTYRIIKDVYDYNEDGENKSCYLTAEFTVSDGIDYVRTDGYADGAKYPVVTLINDIQALNSYISSNEGTYNFESDEFKAVSEKYDEGYFNEKALVLVLLEESSGSVRHEVNGVSDDGVISITRSVPEMGTDDMAQWHIFIEIPKTHPALKVSSFTVSMS